MVKPSLRPAFAGRRVDFRGRSRRFAGRRGDLPRFRSKRDDAPRPRRTIGTRATSGAPRSPPAAYRQPRRAPTRTPAQSPSEEWRLSLDLDQRASQLKDPAYYPLRTRECRLLAAPFLPVAARLRRATERMSSDSGRYGGGHRALRCACPLAAKDWRCASAGSPTLPARPPAGVGFPQRATSAERTDEPRGGPGAGGFRHGMANQQAIIGAA